MGDALGRDGIDIVTPLGPTLARREVAVIDAGERVVAFDHGREILAVAVLELATPLDEVHPVMDPNQLTALIRAVRDIRVEPSIRNYVVALVRATREHASVRLGASPRATLALYHAAQALAAIRGRPYVVPDDVKALAGPVLGHRLLLTSQARLRGRSELTVLDEVVASTPVPVE